MTDKHTPGPWFVVPYGDGHDTVICKDEAGNQRIAFMAVPGSRDEQSRRKKWAEIKANARLIAAAPELLELAHQYISDLRHPMSEDSRLRRIERAEKIITKARGEA